VKQAHHGGLDSSTEWLNARVPAPSDRTDLALHCNVTFTTRVAKPGRLAYNGMHDYLWQHGSVTAGVRGVGGDSCISVSKIKQCWLH
jgi:hypothetical protein